MDNRGKVIKALEEAIPFIDSRGYGGVAEIMHDALSMLKEQEAEIKEKNLRIRELLCERDGDDGK